MIYTSLKLSKLLKANNCKLKSKYYYSNGKLEELDSYDYLLGDSSSNINSYDIANDILIRYAKNFFGEEKVYSSRLLFDFKYEICTKKILSMLQQGKDQEEIEDYIWENTIFNNKNKGKDE